MSELPQGWVTTNLNDISSIVTGKTPSKKNISFFNGPIPFIKPGDINNQGIIKNTLESLSLDGANTVPHIPKNSIAVTCIGNLGRVAITSTKSATNQQINSVIPFESINVKYLYYYLRTIKSWMENNSSATTVTIINKTRFSLAPVLIAPLNEQIRIANKLDSLLGKLEATQKHLDKIPTLLKRFRQSVLAAAVSGELTAEWRISHSVNQWKSSTFENILIDSANGLSKRKGSTGKAITVLRLADFKNGIRKKGVERTINLDEKERKKYALKDGDILVIRVNGSVDLAGLFIKYESDNEEIYCDHFIRFRLDQELVLPDFMTFIANAGKGRKYLKSKLSTSAGQNTINQTSIKNLSFLLPSLLEQKQIVHQVESLFKLADKVEQQYQAAKQRTDKLTQSILAKAFRGELVPQDPNDEPASELLKRIQLNKA